VLRREFVGGLIGAAATPAPARLYRLLYVQDARPVGLTDLHATLAQCRADFRATRYATLEPKLADLCAAARATRIANSGRARETASAVLSRAYSLRSELATKQADHRTAWLTSDRALVEARDSGDPLALAEAAVRVSVAMRQASQFDDANDLLTATATDLQNTATADRALAAYGMVQLVASYTHAQARNRANALERLAEAETAAARLAAPVGEFSPAQCLLFRISVHTALGDAVAVDHARALDIRTLPNTERRARYYTDTARAWHMLGNPERTLLALQEAERVAPEDARRPSMRALTADALASAPNIAGMRPFAQRIGAVTG
jgi:tetratricopeptide (TPR) repeat protein